MRIDCISTLISFKQTCCRTLALSPPPSLSLVCFIHSFIHLIILLSRFAFGPTKPSCYVYFLDVQSKRGQIPKKTFLR